MMRESQTGAICSPTSPKMPRKYATNQLVRNVKAVLLRLKASILESDRYHTRRSQNKIVTQLFRKK